VTRRTSPRSQMQPVQVRVGEPPRRSRRPSRLGVRFRRWWWALHRPVDRRMRSLRSRRRYRHGADKVRRWRRSSPLTIVLRGVSYVGGVIVLAAIGYAAVIVITGNAHHGPVDIEAACTKANFSCSAVAGTLGPVFSLALATALFLMVRLRMVRRPYLRMAVQRPREVVPTAGSIIGEVVGRDELCNVIIADTRDPRTRRPHVIIGGLGTGKTALLVRMTQLLADRHAVPVAVRLRAAQTELDFRDLARRRFVENTHGALLSEDEQERIWRQLLRDDQIVVLADGLEEALLDETVKSDRDNVIRSAFYRARRERLPLIVASRPHDPLRAMDAAIVQLEPLTEEDALKYIQRGDPDEDIRRLDWIVETADVAETPFYLQITHQLHHARLLEHFVPQRVPGQFDARSVDRAELRFRLLRTWEHAVITGHLPPGVPLGSQDRAATVEQLSVLACIGLRQDLLQVKLDDFDELRKRSKSQPGAVPVVEALEQRLKKIGRPLDIRLAATWGMELGLVETQGDSVRFPHSIMQSYLGSRLIDSAMADPEYQKVALKEPGRELLMALVMRSRDKATQAGPQRVAPHSVRVPEGKESERPVPAVLAEAACKRNDVRALYLFAAALSIDCVVDRPAHAAIADMIKQYWPDITVRDDHALEEAKLNLIRRYGEAARIIAERQKVEPDLSARPAYIQLFSIASSDSTYSVRLVAAQEIGAGGDVAFDALEPVLGPPAEVGPGAAHRRGDQRLAGEQAVATTATGAGGERKGAGDGERKDAAGGDRKSAGGGGRKGAGSGHRKGRASGGRKGSADGNRKAAQTGAPVGADIDDLDGAHARDAAAAGMGDSAGTGEGTATGPGEGIAAGTGDGIAAGTPDGIGTGMGDATGPGVSELGGASASDFGGDEQARELRYNENVMRVWLAPLLVGSVARRQVAARQNLARWLQYARALEVREGAHGLGLSLEAGLALGFKQAANRRREHPYAQEEARAHLIERATEMLRASQFWFTRLVLIQALCLWQLPDQPTERERRPGRAVDFRMLVRHWGGVPPDGIEHPFVAEARKLAVWALETGQPERFLWIDESGIVSQIGSRPADPGSRRKHNLWIPPSAGWAALHPRAQQLVADVLLFLNLAERGRTPGERERRLRRTNRNFLPTCLAGDRFPLDPTRTIGTVASWEPGSYCAEGCHFELCPYPPKGAPRYRVDLSEAFCRRQQVLLGRATFRSRAAPWQRALPADLKRFWKEMGQPPRHPEADDEPGGRWRRRRYPPRA
jgi:hypothetical protein